MTDKVLGRWRGQTVVCAGSGPSLTVSDLEAVRAAGLPVIVANNTWQAAPWADVLVAMDTAWWKECGAAAAAGFAGERIGFTSMATKFGATYSTHISMVHSFGNSGAYAIAVAVRGRAARVLLLGFDGAPAVDGRLHWHADHPAPLKNPQQSIAETWPRQFRRVAEHAAQAKTVVINCSRATHIEAFPRMALEEALRDNNASGYSTNGMSGMPMPAAPPAGTATAPRASVQAEM